MTSTFVFSQKRVFTASARLCARLLFWHALRAWQWRSEERGAYNRELNLVSWWGKVKEHSVAICCLVFFGKTIGLILPSHWIQPRDTNLNSFCVMNNTFTFFSKGDMVDWVLYDIQPKKRIILITFNTHFFLKSNGFAHHFHWLPK